MLPSRKLNTHVPRASTSIPSGLAAVVHPAIGAQSPGLVELAIGGDVFEGCVQVAAVVCIEHGADDLDVSL